MFWLADVGDALVAQELGLLRLVGHLAALAQHPAHVVQHVRVADLLQDRRDALDCQDRVHHCSSYLRPALA